MQETQMETPSVPAPSVPSVAELNANVQAAVDDLRAWQIVETRPMWHARCVECITEISKLEDDVETTRKRSGLLKVRAALMRLSDRVAGISKAMIGSLAIFIEEEGFEDTELVEADEDDDEVFDDCAAEGECTAERCPAGRPHDPQAADRRYIRELRRVDDRIDDACFACNTKLDRIDKRRTAALALEFASSPSKKAKVEAEAETTPTA